MARKKEDPDTVLGYPRTMGFYPDFKNVPDRETRERNLKIEAKNDIKRYTDMLFSQEITCDRWFRLVRDCVDATCSNIASERFGGYIDDDTEVMAAEMKEKQLNALIELSVQSATLTPETSIEEKRAFKNAACRLSDI